MYEDLIKALRDCANDSCEYCAYLKQDENCFVKFCGILQDAADAIEALSKTEKTTQQDERLTPKKPKVSVDTLVCPECGRDVEFQTMLGVNILFHGQHDFCPNCGQAIDWTDY